MKKAKPLKGLLLYFAYSAGWKMGILYLQVLVWGVAYLIWGGIWLQMIFGINAIAGPTLVIATGMGNKEIAWEKFQLSMPVRRRDLAMSQYLSVGLAPLIGVPVFILFAGLGSIWHETIPFTPLALFATLAPFLAMPYILSGLLFPLFSIPALENKQDGFFSLFFLASAAIPQLIVLGANHFDWRLEVSSSLTLLVSLVIFVGSYFITRRMYGKMNF